MNAKRDPGSVSEAVMVEGYEHLTGEHCGSTALRNLLGFAGVEISEAMALGLGAGAGFFYVPDDDARPSRFISGRGANLERDFLELTGLALRMRTFAGPDESWEAARAAIDGGRPALLLTDLYHLDHYGRSAHFPGHAVVLAGYDAERAYLSDTGFEELQATSLESLRRARHVEHPIMPVAGHMVTVQPDAELDDPRAAAPAAIELAAARMLEPEHPGFSGISGIERFAAEVSGWPAATVDWRWSARFAYQVIERRGTGGGAFRLMYSRFLEECGRPEAATAASAAAAWTELAAALYAASEVQAPEPELWAAAGERAGAVLELERALWTALAA